MDALGFAIDVSPDRRRGFDPAALFAGGAGGIWIDPSDPRTMFEDAAGTIPAAVDGPVGRIADKSGRGNHATQSLAASRPTLRRDPDGRHALEFDGIDDFLVHGFGGPGDVTLSCAAQRTGGSGTTGLFGATPPATRLQAGIWSLTLVPFWGSSEPEGYRSAGRDASVRSVLTVVGRANPDVHRMLTNGGAAVEMPGSYGGDTHDRRTIGREFRGTMVQGQFSGRLYALSGVARALTEDELRELVAHQAAQAGIRS